MFYNNILLFTSYMYIGVVKSILFMIINYKYDKRVELMQVIV